MMRRLKYFLAGGLIGVGTLMGLLCLLAVIWAGEVPDDPNALPNDSTKVTVIDAAGVFLLLGAPPIVMGSALWWVAMQRDKAHQDDRLQRTFFNLLQQQQGRMTVLDFAMATKLDGDAAKVYLDNKALEFSADFDVNSEGTMLYCFNTAQPEVASLEPTAPTYDVIIQSYPGRKRKAIALAIARSSDLSETQVQQLLKAVKQRPTAVQQGVSQVVAQQWRQRLEDFGATVLVILR